MNVVRTAGRVDVKPCEDLGDGGVEAQNDLDGAVGVLRYVKGRVSIMWMMKEGTHNEWK